MIVRELIATFGVHLDAAAMAKAEASVKRFAVTSATLLAGVYVAKKVLDAAFAQLEWAHNIELTSKRLGIQTDELQGLYYAGAKVGVTQERMSNALGFFVRVLGSAGQEMGKASGSAGRFSNATKVMHSHVAKASEGTSKLGKSLNGIDFQGVIRGTVSTTEALYQATDAIEKIPTAAGKAAYARQLFGRQWQGVIDVFNGGRESIDIALKQLKELGGVVNKQTIEAASNLNKRWISLKYTIEALGHGVLNSLIGPFTKFLDVANKTVLTIAPIIRHSKILMVTLVALGGVLAWFAAGWIVANAAIIGIVAAIAAVVLIVEDLYQLFTGGKSLIGRFVDSLFGIGAAAKFVDDLKESWNSMVQALEDSGILDVLKEVLKIVFKLAFGGAFAAIVGALGVVAVAAETVFSIFHLISNVIESIVHGIKIIGNLLHKTGLDTAIGANWKYEDNLATTSKPMGSSSKPFGPSRPERAGSADFPNPFAWAGRLLSSPMGSSSNTNNNSINVTVNAPPGADAKEIARLTAEEVSRKKDEQNRRETHAFVNRFSKSATAVP